MHPSQAILGVQRGIELMRRTGGGAIAEGIIDAYPLKPDGVIVDLAIAEVERLLGISLPIETAAQILTRLEFDVTVAGDSLRVVVPDHRMDISTDPVIGQADLTEEIARIYGYDRLPNTIIADAMPPQWANVALETEEFCRDILVRLGLQEEITHRFTAPEHEALLTPGGGPGYHSLPYVELSNPIAPDKTVLRHSLLANMLSIAALNARYRDRQRVFEIGAVFLPVEGELLPDEPRYLTLLMTGKRYEAGWNTDVPDGLIDYYDLKGVVDGLLSELKISDAHYSRAEHPTWHPGRSAVLSIGEEEIGVLGELHPQVAQNFDLNDAPVMVAEFNLDKLLAHIAYQTFDVKPVPVTPPVYQDIALVVPASTSAAEVEAVIWQAGGELLKAVKLFDVYEGESIAAGHKSLAYNLTYQTDAKTLRDKDVAKVHKQIVRAAEHRLGATLRA